MCVSVTFCTSGTFTNAEKVRRPLYLLLLKIRSLFNEIINSHIFHIQDISFFFISVQSAFFCGFENLKGTLHITEIKEEV